MAKNFYKVAVSGMIFDKDENKNIDAKINIFVNAGGLSELERIVKNNDSYKALKNADIESFKKISESDYKTEIEKSVRANKVKKIRESWKVVSAKLTDFSVISESELTSLIESIREYNF